ncbi:uncharacterized protein LOC132275227 isoform X2 [Cornus florida]|uniref:uncharacterized protein LOC132275227 isoform X2 n=1 Tax=Cornus florida TaxID=4283 RepID=UPI00289ED69E|nr:uncharacterized protein LOC132275227 isoform X2 [Cornus florida]
MKPNKMNLAVDLSENDTQTFDSQFSPVSVSGEDFKGQDVDELQFLQKSVPFDDTIRLENTFETQVVNLGGETQVLDDPDCVENMDTQLLFECNEGIVDSDGEGTDRTEVLDDTDEVSDGDSLKKFGNHPVDLANMLHGTLCKKGDQGFKVESNALSNEQCGSGERFEGEDVDELQFLQSAVPFDDTVPLEDASETQMMNLGGETQALDGPCVEDMGTQLLVECGNEVVDDSDGEATTGTEVLGNQELSDNDSVKRVHNDPVDPENILYTTLCKQNNRGFKAESDAYNELRSSELNVSTATPLDIDTGGPKAGSVRKGFTSVRAASLRASGLAARRKSFEGTNSGSCSIGSEYQSVKEHIFEDDGVPRDSFQFGEPVNQEHILGDYNEQMMGFRNENKCRLGSSTVRKLFTEDTLAEIKEPNGHIYNAAGGADLPQLLACDKELAGLSYVDSQEPGESSQANALDFVDRFLKFSVTEFDQEAHHGKSTGDKSKHVSSAKGTQCVARRANCKSTVSRIFDWDDNLEDERGGDFFSKMKESFFDNGDQSQRSFTKTRKLRRPDSKRSGAVNESRDKEELLDTHEKIVGIFHSDSRLEFHNEKGIDTTAKLTRTKVRKNLIKAADEQLNIGSSDALEATGIQTDMLDMLNVGFDTQMAAEAMEALCHRVDISDCDRSDANQGAKSMSNDSLNGGKKNRAHFKHNFLQKKESSSNCRVVARQPKQTNRIDAKQSKDSPVSSRKHSQKVKKPSDIDLVSTKLKKAKCNAEELLATNNCWDNRPSEVVKKGKGKKSLKLNDIDESDKCHVTASSSGRMSVKKQDLQEQLGTFTPIACRTRQCKKAITQAGNASTDVREGINDLTEVAALKGKRKRSSKGVDSFEVLNDTQKFFRLGSILSGELEDAKLSEHKQPGPKFTGKAAALKIDELSCLRGRRTHRKLSGQLNRTANQHGSSKQCVGKEANAQSIERLKRSKTDAISTCMDLNIKRQTRSSTHAGSVLSSLDFQSDQRSLQQSVVRGRSGDATINHNSVDINGNTILKDVDGVQASQQVDRKSDADKSSSADCVGVNGRLDTSPREGCKPSGSECATPVNCRTPIIEASPICMGDEYLKQSCRKNLARASLMKELDSLIGNGLECTSPFKDSRKRRDMANIRALFSHHLDDDTIKQQKKILARLGASIASSISVATHFITDKFVRTRNMLEAIAFGKPVVTHLWLESCGQASCFIDEKNYILRDAKKEKEFGFSLPVSLARACQSPLLQGQKVLITPNTKPGKEVLASLVKAVHGLAVERIGRSALKDDRIPDDLLVLSCEEDYAVCVPFLEKGAAVYSSELLLNGIVTQKLEFQRIIPRFMVNGAPRHHISTT